jgi:hypothetical protein
LQICVLAAVTFAAAPATQKGEDVPVTPEEINRVTAVFNSAVREFYCLEIIKALRGRGGSSPQAATTPAATAPGLNKLQARRRLRKPRPPVPGSERVSVEKAAAILGPPMRTLQALAARGEIPGAAKLGGRWTFDIEKLRRLVRQRERETWQSGKPRPDVTGGAIPSGHGLKFVGAKSDGRFTQVTQRLRGRNIRLGGSG